LWLEVGKDQRATAVLSLSFSFSLSLAQALGCRLNGIIKSISQIKFFISLVERGESHCDHAQNLKG
jgi:hypothetical protein